MITYDVFSGGCKSVFTMSYDDGKTEDRRLVALMNKYGIKGTFNLNSGRLGSGDEFVRPDEVKELYRGHEVAVHTVTHPWLNRCSADTLYKEIAEDRRALERLVGYPVRGMAYPFGLCDDRIVEVAKNAGIVYSRTTSRDDFNIPSDFLRLKSTCHHRDALEMLEKFSEYVKPSWRSGCCFYVWGHSYEFKTEEDWANIEKLFIGIKEVDSVWFATNIEIYDYLTAQRSLRITLDEDMVENPTSVDVWIKKDGKVVKIPKCSTVML